MQQAGTASWAFTHDVGQLPNAVLYVRDALRLPVGQGTGVPPPLIDEVPDRSALIQGADLTVAAAEWAAWWKAVGEFEGRVQTAGR